MAFETICVFHSKIRINFNGGIAARDSSNLYLDFSHYVLNLEVNIHRRKALNEILMNFIDDVYLLGWTALAVLITTLSETFKMFIALVKHLKLHIHTLLNPSTKCAMQNSARPLIIIYIVARLYDKRNSRIIETKSRNYIKVYKRCWAFLIFQKAKLSSSRNHWKQ